MNFGVLRVLNDDIVHPNSGFGMHPHKDMEIISYIVKGEITHEDSMGHKESLQRGEVQYMSAGTGVLHSEYNHGSEDLRLLQIWILPPQKNMQPLYGSYRFKKQDRDDRLLHMVSSLKGNAKVQIHQDVNIYASELQKSKELVLDIQSNRQLYVVQIEGWALYNGLKLDAGDALKAVDEKSLHIQGGDDTHLLIIEMAKSHL
jgi:redox-sensitive bicupin YhaK (pirin superfamily)